MKIILLPTDFSESAWNAMFTALKLYADFSCHFIVLNSYEPNIANLLEGNGKQRIGVIYESMSKQLQVKLDKIIDYLRKNHKNPNHTFEKISIANNLLNAIKDTIHTHHIECIIMGATGATGAKEVFVGSNSVKVVMSIRNRPIIVVPKEYSLQRLKRVAFPTNFLNYFEASELNPMLELVRIWKAETYIFQVGTEFIFNDLQATNTLLLEKYFSAIDHSFHKVEFKGNVADTISDFAETNAADIIALIHYSHSFFEKLTREAVVKRMGFHTNIPLLVLTER
ncbi:universal stress protein [Arenibacter certesii]|uniref:Universal stress protein UspA n=1 Tax=Arenibacter certesii TaxID=228955 RepID=A0A918IS08_9FLAO|nr:universal stress protein [Arenibacter certesii]GGW29459.1 universal stress protein UspA [Arenibacter certesii]